MVRTNLAVNNKKKILIHSLVFSPDGVSTAYLYNDIAKGFKSRGYEVVVLTTTPHYNLIQEDIEKQPIKKRWFGLFGESSFEGMRVMHVPQKKFKSLLMRFICFVYWHVISFFLALREKNISVILSPSPPLTIGLLNLMIGRIKGAKVIYNVQEIYPDFLIEQRNLKSKTIINLLKWLERCVYNKSDAITTIDEIFYNTIKDRFEDQKKLHIIPNFVDIELYRPLDRIDLAPNTFLSNDHVKLMYAGNIGHAQDWEPLLTLAKELEEEPFDFYIIGEGVLKQDLENKVKNNALKNVYILPYQRRELMPHLLAFADIQFIFMSKEMEGHGFPSKVYTIMACAKPLLVCSGEGSPIVNFLRKQNCAKIVTANKMQDKVSEMVRFLRSTTNRDLKKMGENGFAHVKANYSKDVVVKKYIDLIESLIY